MAGVKATNTIWRRGCFDGRRKRARLLFGRMYEDWRIEREVFDPASPVFCIASAGCTAMALARAGYDVTAVDINPAQIQYVQRRLTDSATCAGAAERILTMGRLLLASMGLSSGVLRRFLSCPDLGTQQGFFNQIISRRLHQALSIFLQPIMLRRFYARPLSESLPPRFADVLWGRLRSGFSRCLNLSNEYASLLLLGSEQVGYTKLEVPPSMRLIRADAAEYLEQSPAGSFGGFALSNVLDGADSAYGRRLLSAVRRAARPGAIFVLRSFAEPADEAQRLWAGLDRAMIWGGIRVERIHDGCAVQVKAFRQEGGRVSCSIN